MRPRASREVVLDLCLDRLLAGGDPAEVLAAYPRQREEVRPLLDVALMLIELAHRVEGLSEERRARLWTRVGIRRAAALLEESRQPRERSARGRPGALWRLALKACAL